MAEFVLTSLVIFTVLAGWLYVQDVYRRFAARHPELGPYRQEGGCGGSCSCSQENCSVPESKDTKATIKIDLITPQRCDRH